MAALEKYVDEKRYHIDLFKADGVHITALYLEVGGKLIAFAEGSDYFDALEELRAKVLFEVHGREVPFARECR